MQGAAGSVIGSISDVVSGRLFNVSPSHYGSMTGTKLLPAAVNDTASTQPRYRFGPVASDGRQTRYGL